MGQASIFGLRSWASGFELGFRSWTSVSGLIGLGLWTLVFEFRSYVFGLQILSFGHQPLGVGLRTLGFGHWSSLQFLIFDPVFGLGDVGVRLRVRIGLGLRSPVFEFRVKTPKSRFSKPLLGAPCFVMLIEHWIWSQ